MFRQVDSTCNHIDIEHRVLAWWEEVRAFDKLREQNAGKPRWSFLDGPITANNPMGVHHAWGRTLKDCYQRYFAMTGHELRYQNGFDCQGLWVEVEVEKEMGYATKADIVKSGLEDFINRCKARVARFSRIQTDQSIRLGYWMDWDNSYYTLSDENNYTIWAFLKKCHERGLIYKGRDAMPWCPRCETGISEQERREGYVHVEDLSVFLRFPLLGRDDESLLVWTTTPWTLAANVAAAVNPSMTYIKVRQAGHVLYIAASREHVLKERGAYDVLERLPGKALLGLQYQGPFDDLDVVGSTFADKGYVHRVIAWEEVSEGEGTGIVHIAPGCGKEDFDLGKELDLPVLMPIEEDGTYVAGYGFLTGKSALEVGEDVVARLREKGIYYKRETYGHDYPHCWRCSTPLLFRAVDEWYIDMSWREEIKAVVDRIRWIPTWGRDQELNWLENMHDWMISKKRFWGLALPIFECECGWFDVVGSKEELRERAIAGWEQFEGNSPHRPWVDGIRIRCERCGRPARRIEDVGNPWLDAGIVPYSTVRYNTDRAYWEKWIPADLVLECFPGQFRNWFYALLAMSTMMENVPPFKTLLGHALVRDEEGKEMHKSTGNAIWFDDAVERMGADVMRWIYCGQIPTHNLSFGYRTGDQVRRRVFSTWWNTYSFFVNYARLDGFDPRRDRLPYAQLQDIDRWLLSKLQVLVDVANKALGDYDVPRLVAAADDFIERMSNWYIRRNRRRFWRPRNQSDADKLAAYQTLYRVLVDLAKVLAPVAPFITEEMYQNLVRSWDTGAPESVHHCAYPAFDASLFTPGLAEQVDLVADVVSRVLGMREAAQIRVRQPLRRLVIHAPDEETTATLQRFETHILDELNIKAVSIVSDISEFIRYEVKPNHKRIGPRFGKETRAVLQALADVPASQVVSTLESGDVLRLESGGKTYELGAEDVIVNQAVAEQMVMSEESPALILDIHLDDELRTEGRARDIVRHIQQLRKERGLEVQNHIHLAWRSNGPSLRQALQVYRDHIQRETLCDRMIASDDLAGEDVKTIELAGETLSLRIVTVV